MSVSAENALDVPGRTVTAIVLLVDDQPIVAEMIRRMFADEPDVEYHYCKNAVDAVTTAERIKPTVILQDLIMPDMDGLTLLRAYRANAATQDIPVVVLSTKEDPAVKSTSFALGANDYLVKPPNDVELVARIRHQSNAYVKQMHRDEEWRMLRESQRLLLEKERNRERPIGDVDEAGLSTLDAFHQALPIEWQQAASAQKSFAVLMIDLDNFKSFIDTYGHAAGDEAIGKVAASIKRCCSGITELVARYGGEQFIVGLCAASEEARALGEAIRRGVEGLEIAHARCSTAPVLTVSVGGDSAKPHTGDRPESLIEAADVALYDAKRAGKNRLVFGP